MGGLAGQGCDGRRNTSDAEYWLEPISVLDYIPIMTWAILEHPDFAQERETLPEEVSDRLDAVILLLEQYGPQLGRPHVDTLVGSEHANMKEIRIKGQGVWRFAFAFDEERNAVVLVGGNKQGKNQKRFYKRLITTADRRFGDWLEAE